MNHYENNQKMAFIFYVGKIIFDVIHIKSIMFTLYNI